MAGIWRSERLLYRAVEKEDCDELLPAIASDPASMANASYTLISPQSKKEISQFLEFLEKAMLACIVCIPAESKPDDKATPAKPIPIGLVTLMNAGDRRTHHRQTELGIQISKPYQGKGYGSEAIYWAADWAFQYAGMHRVEIVGFGSNPRAIRLYERLGFTLEGRKRECLFVHGRFWDVVVLSMLEDEWRQKRDVVLKLNGSEN